MVTKNTLDTLILNVKERSISAHSFADKDVGIEVELEGQLLQVNDVIDNPVYWVTKADGSLRGGFEYVLKSPIKLDTLPAALKELGKALGKMKPTTSIRTSTHYHVNVLNQTVRETYQSTFFYYLIEELLIDTQPKDRHGNLFCLLMSNSAYIHWVLERSLMSGQFFNQFNEDSHKYSAFNLCTVNRFGSLEFRMFAAMTDTGDLERWARCCVEIVRNGAKYHPKDLLKMYDDMPVKKFLSVMLPESSWLYQSKTADYLNSCLHKNYDRLTDLARVFGSEQQYRVPRSMWEEDSPELSPQQLQYEALYGSQPEIYDDPPPQDLYDSIDDIED